MNVLIAALSSPGQLNGVSRHGINLARALLTSREVGSVHFMAGAWQKSMFRDGLPKTHRLHLHWADLASGA